MSLQYWKYQLNRRKLKPEEIPMALPLEVARKYFQDLALGIDYCNFFLKKLENKNI